MAKHLITGHTSGTYAQEFIQVGDKSMQRWRTDKRVKRYLREKRPISDDDRLYNYRTVACIGYNKAVEDKADPALLEFLESEYLWAVDRLMRFDPASMARLGYDVPKSLLQIELFPTHEVS